MKLLNTPGVAFTRGAIAATFLLLGHAAAQVVAFPKMDHLKDTETFHSTRLSPAEVKQISEEVERTAFDTPDSWESELRVRRISLGESSGLVLQGTKLLCGATGNCQTWVLRRAGNQWRWLFESQAPIASMFGFATEASNGIKNFVVVANSSASDSKYVVYKFDGKFYRESACYSRHAEAEEKSRIEKVSCK